MHAMWNAALGAGRALHCCTGATWHDAGSTRLCCALPQEHDSILVGESGALLLALCFQGGKGVVGFV